MIIPSILGTVAVGYLVRSISAQRSEPSRSPCPPQTSGLYKLYTGKGKKEGA